jgi:hypothetical protein
MNCWARMAGSQSRCRFGNEVGPLEATLGRFTGQERASTNRPAEKVQVPYT